MVAFAEVKTFTWTDIQALPSDGLRRELVGGQLLVTPASGWSHQRAVANLYYLLRTACTAEHEVVIAPFDWYLAEDTYFEPDLLVVPRPTQLTQRFEGVPLLVVEVLSPSTRTADRVTKMDTYARAGAPHYWIVDPEAPDITAQTLEGDRYREVGRAQGEEALRVTRPFAVEVIPARLID